MAGIIRQPTKDELSQESIGGPSDPEEVAGIGRPIGYKRFESPENKFHRECAEEEQKARKNTFKEDGIEFPRPFASQIAKLDAKEAMQKAELSWKKRGFVIKTDYPKMDWAKYSNLKNFELIDEEPREDMYLSDKYRLPVSFKKRKYKYKESGYTYTVMETKHSALKRAQQIVEKSELPRKVVVVEEKKK